jgi:2-keto-4-pentenoate hydratase
VPERMEESAADRLRSAGESRQPIGRVSREYDIDVPSAYAVQAIARRRAIADGRVPCGWKIGLTSPSVQAHFGVNEPDYGALFADMGFGPEAEVPTSRLIQPRGETEIAFVLKHGLPGTDIDLQTVTDAVDYLTIAVEIVDSRIENWDLTAADTIADNASAAMFVLGNERIQPANIDIASTLMQTLCNGAEVSKGVGANCMGNPYLAGLWLARALVKAGTPLQAGDIILTGTLGPMYALAADDRILAQIDGLGSLTFHMSA